ncbi:MAG: sodium:proton antiporter [Planctomycetes bacterium]|nr:sodium:proton antiporter [Planctomycetota bacterium]
MFAPNSLLAALPFAGLLLSIALVPLLLPKVWHHHHGKIALGWGLLWLLPGALQYGLAPVSHGLSEALLLEFLPFIILIITLYVIAGDIRVVGRLSGTPWGNTVLLAVGTLLASVMGTTGATVVLVRPLLRANMHRKARVHQVIFLIFLVSNIGGALTPLGDPPLFLGYLKGVEFFWTLQHVWLMMTLLALILLLGFAMLDWILWKREGRPYAASGEGALRIEGGRNVVLLVLCVGLVLGSGWWAKREPFFAAEFSVEHVERLAVAERAAVHSHAALSSGGSLREHLKLEAEVNALRAVATEEAIFGVQMAGVKIPFIQLLRDALLLALAWMSLCVTPYAQRKATGFTWAPLLEVALLFSGIFVTITPVIAMLKAGVDGPFAEVILWVTSSTGEPLPLRYFWATGMLSGFLDNAPTYLVFFNAAGGEANALMSSRVALMAISAGAVFMGALSYIGNAPNFMARAIAEEAGVKMPSFFGYIARWSFPILIPLFLLLGWIFFA